MSLSAGSRLGPYEIVAAIGAGGMGEVHRARDPRLGRDVAIKVSAEQFGERFEREARAVAALNHPNICTLHDVGPNYLVMELVEGSTLADRIKAGPIPIDEALAIARQIQAALEAAHENDIVHRDLKPANVKITPAGIVKVLDFGLAKMGGTPAAVASDDNSPTLAMATQAGVILGTAAYMSPEQARGKPVDKRADIWAFGVVLHEMVTGRKLFSGDTVSDTLAAVPKEEPPWDRVPIKLRRLLKACLEKDPKQRLHDIGDVWRLLDEAAETPAARRGMWLAVAAGTAAVFVVATVFLAFLYFRQKPTSAEAVRFEISQPATVSNLSASVSVSPDGRKLGFIARGADGRVLLWVRSLETLEARPLEGTRDVAGLPFWSPDSRFIAYGAGGALNKIEATGGPPQILCTSPGVIAGGFWTRDNKIVFGTSSSGLLLVPAAGGSPSLLTVLDAARRETAHLSPSPLPDGQHFLYTRGGGGNLGSSLGLTEGGIFVGSLDGKTNDGNPKKLLADISSAFYVPAPDTSTGYVLFVRQAGSQETLMAQPFDARRLELSGEAVPVAQGVPVTGFSASANRVLVYYAGPRTNPSTGAAERQLTWFDRRGSVSGTVGEPALYTAGAPSISPDEKRAAVARVDGQNGNVDIWLFEFARGVSTRFTFDPATELFPVWSPDGSRLAYASNRNGHVDWYQKSSNGAGEEQLLLKSDDDKIPISWSRDGRFLIGYSVSFSDTWVLPMEGQSTSTPDRPAFSFLHAQPEFRTRAPRFSPDGRFVSYVSNESGKSEIYVRPFDPAAPDKPTSGGKWMVSKDGGDGAHWRADGKELFYLELGSGSVMSVDIATSPAFQAGVPKTLFKIQPGWQFWDASPDGQRFLIPVPVAGTPTSYKVVLNWTSTLKP